MKATNWIASEQENTTISSFTSQPSSPSNQEANCFGRIYNESVNFNQSNFEAFQNILNQRNQMLSSVKSAN